MKRLYLFFLLLLFPVHESSAFDISGLQPLGPKGVFSTFSTESLSRKQAAVELGFERSKEPDFYRMSLRGAYGLSDSLEFNFTVPYIYKFGDSLDGMEDICVGFKHRFYDEGKYGPSLAYLVQASPNNGREEFSTKGRFGVGFLVSKRVGPFNGHFNLFYVKPGTGKLHDEVTFLGGLEFSAGNNFKLLAELLARKSHFSSEYDRIEPRFGYRVRTTENVYTTLGIGFDVRRRNPELRILASVSYLSPVQKHQIKKIFEKEE